MYLASLASLIQAADFVVAVRLLLLNEATAVDHLIGFEGGDQCITRLGLGNVSKVGKVRYCLLNVPP